jgi:anaerobic dimethyl sulfoxide reductase subunit B (iron-sulfur subunit)
VTLEHGRYPHTRVEHLSVACNHCAQPACVEACPAGALARREEDGVVLLDSSLCDGCRACEHACPYGAIQYDEATGRMGKCDACAELVSRGEQPVCVTACTMRVLRFGWLDEMGEGQAAQGRGLPDPALTRPSLRISFAERVSPYRIRGGTR